jgi:uncharacterized alkaline shock family protein YloU
MATISTEVLARYAADAAREVDGVQALVESPLHRHKGVRVLPGDDGVRVELHLAVDWGASIPDVGRAVQEGVAAYLARMASIELQAVDVVVDEVRPLVQ